MSKITNDGLTRSGTGCFSCTVHPFYGNSGRRRVKPRLHWRSTEQAWHCNWSPGRCIHYVAL